MSIFDLFKKKEDPSNERKIQKAKILILETILLAVDKFHENEYSKALRLLDEVLKLDPENQEYILHYYRSLSNYYLDNNAEAMKDIDITLEIKQTAEAYCHKGLLYNETKDYLSAIECFNKAETVDKNYEEIYEHRAKSKSKTKDNLGALADYSKAIELNSNNPSFFYERGFINFKLRKYDNAIEDLDKAIQIGLPDKSHIKMYQLFSFRGGFKKLNKDIQGAIDDFTQAIKLKPESTSDYFERAESYFEINDYHKAIKDYDEIIKIEPENGKAYFLRSQAKAELDETYREDAVFDKIKSFQLGYDEDDEDS